MSNATLHYLPADSDAIHIIVERIENDTNPTRVFLILQWHVLVLHAWCDVNRIFSGLAKKDRECCRIFLESCIILFIKSPRTNTKERRVFMHTFSESSTSTSPLGHLQQFMQQHPVFSFFFITYAFSWILSIPFILSEWVSCMPILRLSLY